MSNSNLIRKALILLERAGNPDNISFDYVPDGKGDITKVVATLKSYDSGRYTKLGRNLKRIERIEARMKALKEQTKAEARELVADLFTAEDAALTRVVDTVSFIFQMTKDPKESKTVKYAKVLEELQEKLTPELLSVMESLIAKHSSEPVQKAAALKAIDKAEPVESLGEGIMDRLRPFFKKLLGEVLNWGKSYDSQLNSLKAQAGIGESIAEDANGDDTFQACGKIVMAMLQKGLSVGLQSNTRTVVLKPTTNKDDIMDWLDDCQYKNLPETYIMAYDPADMSRFVCYFKVEWTNGLASLKANAVGDLAKEILASL